MAKGSKITPSRNSESPSAGVASWAWDVSDPPAAMLTSSAATTDSNTEFRCMGGSNVCQPRRADPHRADPRRTGRTGVRPALAGRVFGLHDTDGVARVLKRDHARSPLVHMRMELVS